MTTYAVNHGKGQHPVEIEFPNKAGSPKDIIFIQPKSKAKLPAGARIAPNHLKRYPQIQAMKINEVGEPVLTEPVTTSAETPTTTSAS